MTADRSVSVDKFCTTSTSTRILRTMSQSKQTSPAPRAPRMPTTSHRSGEEDAASPGPGMEFSSGDAFRASLAGYYGKCLFRWHRRLLLTAEPLVDNIKKTSEPGSTVLTPTTATGKHQPFSSYVYTNKLLLRQTIPGYKDHHLVICTHCNRVAKPLSESATGGLPKTLRSTV
jgi:hypothetical protein